MENCKVEVCNVNGSDKYIVARAVNGKLWYYSSWETMEKAEAEVDFLADKGVENTVIVEVDK